jgi:hypothetical protein
MKQTPGIELFKNRSLFVGILIVFIFSCQTHTTIEYRLDTSQEYIRQDGYALSCKVDGDVLVVGTYTPESWGPGFYYDYLKGKKSEKRIKIVNVKVRFIETADNLKLKDVRKEREYIFSEQHLADIINNNRQLQLTIYFKESDSPVIVEKEFTLVRFKNTESTGTMPHS